MSTRTILASYDERSIVVYQAYSWSIAGPALAAQRFVPPFSTERMTWIKPSFLWMMHRSAWASAPGQEHILAIRLPRDRFDGLLAEAVMSTPGGGDRSAWKRALKRAAVRVQWDPDRGLHGERLDRRAIQVGIAAPRSAEYAGWPLEIVDLTERVHQIEQLRGTPDSAEARALLPIELEYPTNPSLWERLRMTG